MHLFKLNDHKCVALFPPQVDASRSVDEVFVDVCTIFGELPKLEKKRTKKGKCHPSVVIVA